MCAKPRDRVARQAVDVPGPLAGLDVGDGDVHVRGGQRGDQMLAPVADDEHDVGREPVRACPSSEMQEDAERLAHA